MIKIVMGIFVVLHGLVYLLYLGHSRKLFELQPGLIWPDNAWTFSTFLSMNTIRFLASIACGLVAIGFVISGIGILASQGWSRSVAIGVAGLASVLFVLFWDGTLQKLDGQGGIGVLINIVLIIIFTLQVPNLGF